METRLFPLKNLKSFGGKRDACDLNFCEGEAEILTGI